MFDLSQLQVSDSGTYPVTDPRGNDIVINGVPLTLTIASPGTEKAVAAQFKRDTARSMRMIGSATGVMSKRTAKDDLIERADFLMAVTEGASVSDLTLDGKTGAEALRAMFMSPKLGHIADGVEKFHADRGNFFAGSVTNSANT